MRVHNVHSRELPAPAAETWEVVAGLASRHDQLWPTERWPTCPLVFDRPLAAGAHGGHGLIHYDVERFEPGRCVVFRFARGSGLDGAERATGGRPLPWLPLPRLVRVADAIEGGYMRARVAA
jgi:hypothetical protein